MLNQEPTILVKKSDGSMVRVPLSELKKKQTVGSGISSQSTVTNSPPISNLVVEDKAVNNFKKPLIFTKKKIILDLPELPEKMVEKNFLKKPLIFTKKKITLDLPRPEKAIENSFKKPLIFTKKKIILDLPEIGVQKPIIKQQIKINRSANDVHQRFGVSADLKGRFESLVSSWQKGIRDDKKFVDYLVRSSGDGGMDFEQELAKEVLEFLKSQNSNLKEEKNENKKRYIDTRTNQSQDVALVGEKHLTTSTPVKDIFIDEAEVEFKKNINDKIKLEIQPSKPIEIDRQFKMEKGRAIIDDIAPPSSKVKSTVGPEEEMLNFTLIDLRRLSADPQQAMSIFLGKMAYLKEESFLLYQTILTAWKKSPLYREYLEMARQALINNVNLEKMFSNQNKDQMTYEEYQVLLKINKELSN